MAVTVYQWPHHINGWYSYDAVNLKKILTTDTHNQGSHSFAWIKTKDFSRTFQDQNIYFKDIVGEFHDADLLKIYYVNEENCHSQLFRKAHSI